MTLDSPITDITGVGEHLAKKLAILGIKCTGDLINYYPKRYDDFSDVQTISQIKPGNVTVKATIKQTAGRYSGRGLHITEAVASDSTGSARLIWFNQPYRAAALQAGKEYFISGEFALKRQRLSIQNPSAELVSSFPVNTARIIPIYKETKGLKSSQIRKILGRLLPLIRQLPETLPDWLTDKELLMSRSHATEHIHFPGSSSDLTAAKQRLAFEEVFVLALAALLNKYELLKEEALPVPFNEQLARKFVSHLPFQLTDAQRKVVWQIYKDLQKQQPMNRLIEGDVGSGKTLVAAMAAIMAVEQGYQAALMAPTELLARQHADTLFKLLAPLGLEDRVGLLVGSLKPLQKVDARKRIASGDMRFIVGTQALIQEKTDMHRLALVIIDEQHRFGVDQRNKLQAKAGHMPHVMSMTATPIPRSLALTLYGELDISVIDSKPADRKPIVTKIVPLAAREKLYKDIDEQLEMGRQAFVVCPLITESDFAPGKSAEQVYNQLAKGHFKHRRVGLLHGKLKPAEKDQVMQAFVGGDYDLLVATTVIEVGVDVPNATVMIIENPERFGLAQIHQLRGRVGRSEHQGYCYLVLSDSNQPSQRLRALQSSSDGFKLAEYDLKLRGPGAIYGTFQHGQLDLRIAQLSDTRLIATARARAQEFIDRKENLLQYKELYEHVRANRAVTKLN
jgi:ATP-dependent DNA helicase RecG